MLLEDLAPAEPGDQLAGISVEQAAAALEELAALHAAGWGSAGARGAALAEPEHARTAPRSWPAC